MAASRKAVVPLDVTDPLALRRFLMLLTEQTSAIDVVTSGLVDTTVSAATASAQAALDLARLNALNQQTLSLLDPVSMMDYLAGRLTETQLATDLAGRIDKVDAAGTGLVDLLGQEIIDRGQAITDEASTRTLAIINEAASRTQAIIDASDVLTTLITGEAQARGKALLALDTADTLFAQDATHAAESILQGVLQSSAVFNRSREVAAGLVVATQTLNTVQTDLSLETSYRLSLEAKLNSSIALFSTDASAQVDALSAIATQFTTLQAAINDNLALINTESTARATMVAAEATARQTLAAQVLGSDGTGNTSGLIANAKSIALAADTALASDITTLFADTAGNTAAIQAEATTRSDALTALGSLITTIEVNVAGNLSDIQDEATARASAIDAEATARSALAVQFQGDVDNLTAVLNSVHAASATGEEANTSVITEAISAIEKSAEAILQGVVAGATGMGRSFESVALIRTEQTTRATALLATAELIQTLQAVIGDASSGILQQLTILADADSAAATSFNALDAKIDVPGLLSQALTSVETSAQATAAEALAYEKSLLVADIGANTAAVTAESVARVSELAALAQDVSDVTAVVGDTTAAVQVVSTAQAATDTAVAAANTALTAPATPTASASRVIKVDVNGKIAGFGIYNDGASSDFIINVDKFGIATGDPLDPDSYPFIVANHPVTGVPTVYIKAAAIADASIDTLRLSGQAVTIPLAAAGITTATTASEYFDGTFPVILLVYAEGYTNNQLKAATVTVKVGTTTIKTYPMYIGALGWAGYKASVSPILLYSPVAGNRTFTVTISNNGTACSIVELGVKR